MHIPKNAQRADNSKGCQAKPEKPSLFIPKVKAVDWSAVAADPTVSIVVTNSRKRATRLCKQSQPAISIVGLSKTQVAALLRKRGARVILGEALH